MSFDAIKDRVKSIAFSYGPFAARQWILTNLHTREQQAVGFAALASMMA